MASATLQQDSAFSAERTPDIPATGSRPRQLSARELQWFVAAGRRVELGSGRAVFRRGETGRSMFVVESGRVLLQPEGDLPDRLVGPGEYFGELALFARSRTRSGTAIMVEPGVVYQVDPESFESLLQREPLLAARFMWRAFDQLLANAQAAHAGPARGGEHLTQTLELLHQTRDELQLAQRQICTDDLTGLCNRRGLAQFLDNMAESRARYCRLGLLLVDVDRFKQINDRHGHVVGDRVLRAIASEIQGAASVTDLPCRLGGDEFALLAQVRDRRELDDRALRIAEGVQQLRFPEASKSLKVSVSVGGGLCREDGAWSEWYSDADAALYHVKGSGGDGVHLLG